MSKNLDHLLSKHGVLTSFSIAKKLNDAEIQEMSEKIKLISKNKFDFNNKLKNEIQTQTTNSILNGSIPGLIINKQIKQDTKLDVVKNEKSKHASYNVGKEKLAQLYIIASEFNKEVLNNKLTRNDICFIIYTILNFLEISEEDFKKFHSFLGNDIDDERDEDDEHDDDDDEPYE